MRFKDRFGSHFAIERFGVIFLTLVICMGVLLGSIAHRQTVLNKNYKAGQAIYTSSFVFSKTKSQGNVKGIFVNPDKTKCLLMLKFSDMSKLPIDANEYMCMLTGSDMSMHLEDLESNPNGMMYLFGSTGYAGIYLEDKESFPSQIIALTLRSKNAFAGGVGSEQFDDASFKNFDQARIYFNPGAGNATRVDFLDMDSWTIMDAYAEVIAKGQEKSLRSSLRNTLDAMHKEYVKLNEYALRLDKQNIVMPEFPAEIANDSVIAVDPNDESRTPLTWNNEDASWYNADGSVRYDKNSVWYFYNVSTVLPGGYSYEWQTKHVSDGYLKDITGSDETKDWLAYFAKQSEIARDADYTFTTECDWYDKDGNLFDNSQIDDSASNDVKLINDTISLVMQSWQHIYDLKSKYQMELLPALLKVETDIQTVFQSYTINTNENGKFLMIY